ncbi:MAG: hypothetical protein D6722_06615, partial [Bacteroidetes bacterium]
MRCKNLPAQALFCLLALHLLAYLPAHAQDPAGSFPDLSAYSQARQALVVLRNPQQLLPLDHLEKRQVWLIDLSNSPGSV